MDSLAEREVNIRLAKADAKRAEQAWKDAVKEIEAGRIRADNAKALFTEAQQRLIQLLETR